MIVAPKPLAIVSMGLSPYDFYLTGSRFFNTFGMSTADWDFFATNTPEIQEFLRSLGFLLESSKKYKDANIVFSHYRENVHVQLVDDLDAKIEAQDLLTPFLRFLPKDNHRVMWTAALAEAVRLRGEK